MEKLLFLILIGISGLCFAYAANFFRRLWHKDFYFRWLTLFFVLLTVLFGWAAFQQITGWDSPASPNPVSFLFVVAFALSGITLVWSLRRSNNNG